MDKGLQVVINTQSYHKYWFINIANKFTEEVIEIVKKHFGAELQGLTKVIEFSFKWEC